MDSQQCESKKTTHVLPCVEWVPFAVVMLVIKEMIMTQQTPLVATLIDADNIETQGIGTVSRVVKACDTNVSHQNRTDDLDLVNFLKHY